MNTASSWAPPTRSRCCGRRRNGTGATRKRLGAGTTTRIPDVLQDFWREGIRRNKNYESIITIGLRGANDTPMIPGGTVAQSMALLEEIVGVQRKMIAEEINPDVAEVPQLWCLYKEVQEYYNAGLARPGRRDAAVGRRQLGQHPPAAHRGRAQADRRRGDLLSLRLRRRAAQLQVDQHQSDSQSLGADDPGQGIRRRPDLDRQRGPLQGPGIPHRVFHAPGLGYRAVDEPEYRRIHAALGRAGIRSGSMPQDIADIISGYTRYNGRRKPELLEPTTYSLTNYQEADRVVADFKAIAAKAEEIYGKLPASARDAFYELVLFPAKACAQVNELYVAAGKKRSVCPAGPGRHQRSGGRVSKPCSRPTPP